MNEKYCGKNVLGERTQLRYSSDLPGCPWEGLQLYGRKILW